MDAAAVLQKLYFAGCVVKVDDGKLQASGPLTDELRQLIREHKQALLEELQAGTDFAAEGKRVMDTIRRTGAAKIYSEVLDEVVWFVKDDTAAAEVKKKSSMAVYTLAELRELLSGMDQEDLCFMHKVKKLFSGRIVKEVMPWPTFPG